MKNVSRKGVILIATAVLISACGGRSQPVVYDYYRPAFRQLPPEPVYSRLTWSHLPQPVRPRGESSGPLLNPEISFELGHSTFGEAVEVLAQTIGYSWQYPSEVAGRKVALHMRGTPEEILRRLGEQAKVRAVIDHKSRSVHVVDETMVPELPGIEGEAS